MFQNPGGGYPERDTHTHTNTHTEDGNPVVLYRIFSYNIQGIKICSPTDCIAICRRLPWFHAVLVALFVQREKEILWIAESMIHPTCLLTRLESLESLAW